MEDNKEFFNAQFENKFNEYKEFKAEEYYTLESSNPPPEDIMIPESYNQMIIKNKENSEKQGFDTLQKQQELLKSDLGKTQMINSSVAKVATTTSVASLAVAAVVAINIPSGLFTNFSENITYDIGMDYSAITINMDNFLSNNQYQLQSGDFTIEFPDLLDQHPISLQEGTNTYIIPQLEPNKEYNYKIVCNNKQLGEETYSDSFKTLEYSEPKGVYDSLNSNIAFNEENKTANYYYSVYLSNYNFEVENCRLLIFENAQQELNEIIDPLWMDEQAGYQNFFRGVVDNLTCEELYIYLVGEKFTDGYFENVILYENKIKIDYPSDWDMTKPPLEISNVGYNITPGTIGIFGNVTNVTKRQILSAVINQYDEFDNLMNEGEPQEFEVEPDYLDFTLYADAWYGVKSFDYKIIDLSSSSVIYQSERQSFDASQEYQAVFDVVSPQDAIITYNQQHIQINVDPHFQVDMDGLYQYRLNVYDIENNLLTSTQGQYASSLIINNYSQIEGFYFEYIEVGDFINGEHYYNTYKTEAVEFCYPNFELSSEATFNGQFFEIMYLCDMKYSLDSSYLELEIIGETETYTLKVEDILEKGFITFDSFNGDLGNVRINGKFYFKDNCSSGQYSSINLLEKEYNLSYSFNVEKVIADLSMYDTLIPVTIKFDYVLPNDYQINITNGNDGTTNTIPVTDEYYISGLDNSMDTTLYIQVIDPDGNNFGEMFEYQISKTSAENSYIRPTIVCVNPGDAVVTYNDDGTVNIYRKMNFSCENENVYYNAFIYNYSEYDDITGRTIYYGSYDVIGRDTYAVIEDIPMQNYIFIYYLMLDYQNVSYIMYTETPSGSIEFYENVATATQSVAGEKTLITFNIIQYGMLDNRVLCDGQEYTYTKLDDAYDSTPGLTLTDGIPHTYITIYHTGNGTYYDDYANDIYLKGNKFRAIDIALVAEY